MTDEQNHTGRDEEFPLEAYIAVYEWIAKWAEEACDPEQGRIALAAYESLTEVGILVRNVMRQMTN